MACAVLAAGTTALHAQPANDNPCGAVLLPVNTTCVNTTGTNVAATATAGPPAPGCGYSGGDVWFRLVVPAGGAVTVTGSVNGASTFADGAMAIYSAASCAGPFTLLLPCSDDVIGLMPQITLTGQTPGATLWIRFWEYGNDVFNTFNICALMPPPPPGNDNPCGATALTVGTSCVMQSSTNVNATATTTAPAPSCGLYTGSDVWFTFTASASGIATIETAAGTMTDASFAIYSATNCAGPFTEVACDDDSGPGLMPFAALSGLTPGQTYYIRVFGFLGATGTFTICVHSPALPAGDCVYMLEMFDSFGDGWTGSTVGISINGGPFTNYTITGAYGFALIGLNIGQVLVVQYTAVGPFQGEISYTLSFLSGAGVFSSGSPPATGVVFTQTIDCNPPPAPPEDCLGAITICSGQSFNNNTQNTGLVADLNASNYGCLLASELQGTWYTWSPATSGQVGFTIDPVGPDDYDWAIWGPYPPGSNTGTMCPPSGPPIRCSFASGPSTFSATGSYNTGMGSSTYSPPQWANPTPAYSETAAGDGWVSGINVTAGQVYLMYISNFDQTGLAFSLSWQLAGGASLDCTVLPVELVSFNAVQEGRSVRLEWSTATEINSSHFIVERSQDAASYAPIAEVEGGGNTQMVTNYLAYDMDPRHGLNYYRLLQIDLDGTPTRTPAVSVMFLPQGSDVMLRPNPADGTVDISFFCDVAGEHQLQLIDPSGRTVLMRPVEAANGLVAVRFDLGSLERGLYAVEVFDAKGNRKGTSRLIKR